MKTKKTKWLWLVALATVLVLGLIAWSSLLLSDRELDRLQQDALNELEENAGSYDPHTIVLNNTSKREAEELAEKFGATLRITQDGKFATLTLPDDVTITDIYGEKANKKLIASMSADYMARISDVVDEDVTLREPTAPNATVSDTLYDKQSYLNYLNIGNAWNRSNGSGMTIAIIDTGIDTDHPEFAGRISEYSYNATEDKIVKDYDNDWSLIEDEQGHGTAVAGAFAAAMDGSGTVGVAPQVTILVIKAECTPDGTFCRTSDLVFGLYYAIKRDVAVVNMSFGTQAEDNPFAEAARLGRDSDILMVAAAGNDGNATLTYPAADENVIGVGALAEDSWALAEYSNYGENVNVVAPGTVLAPSLGGGYGTKSGTSLASPLVAASMTLLKSINQYATNQALIEILYASCYDLGDLGADWYFGYGAVDVSAMLCESRGTVTFNLLTEELENFDQLFIRNHTLQNIPEPERLYAVFDGWYYDIECTEPYQLYEDRFTADLTLYAGWVNEEDGVPYTYVTLEDGTVEIRSYTGHRRYITVPDTIDGKTVSSIGDFAFRGESGLRRIHLPDGLKRIGVSAFSGCSALTTIEIPSGVTVIEENAFLDNIRLSSVVFSGDSCLETLGAFAFSGCSKLKRVDLPAGLQEADGSVFYGDISLTAIDVAKTNSAFVSVDGVLFNRTKSTLVAYPAGVGGDYTIPSEVRTVGAYAFAYTRATSVDLGAVTRIGKSAFTYSRLTEVILPDSVTFVDVAAYRWCSALERVTIGHGITKLPTSVFEFDSQLSAVEIPTNIVEIDRAAFQSSGLSALTFADDSRLTRIGSSAFAGCWNLNSVQFPEALVEIGSSAFEGASLTTVTFPSDGDLQTIGNDAFASTSLTAVVFPTHLRQIGEYAFFGTGLNGEVTLPASLTSLGAGAFASCHALTAIQVADGNSAYMDADGVVYSKAGDRLVAYPAGNTATAYTVLNGVQSIGSAAFYGAAQLQTVNLPQGLTELCDHAFYRCTDMRSYALPQTLTTVGEFALSYNIALTSLTLPDSVVAIGRYAFAYDRKLTTITLHDSSALSRIGFASFALTGIRSFRVPANVSTVAQYAFEGCSSLTSITFAKNSKLESISAYMFLGCENIQQITFEAGSHLTSIQAHGLEGMSKLKTINFGGAQLTTIDNYAFRYCSSLTALNVPDTLTDVGRFAFYGCTSLNELALPSGVEHIGAYAFYGTENCDLYFASETLPLFLDENWDNGLRGYYTGVVSVTTDGDWKYATQTNGKIAIIDYFGTETDLDLNALPYGEIETIGGYAFFRSGLTSLILPDDLVQIQRYAFAENTALTDVTIPEAVNYLAQYAFYHTGLQTVTFAGDNLRVMEQYAFAYTRDLTSVTIPASLSKMGSYAFWRSGVRQVIFADGCQLTEIPKAAFAESGLVSVTIPDSVTLVNHSAFRACEHLTSVTFGAGEDLQLMSNAFYKTGLTAVEIPANVRYIGVYCFVGLENLNAFTVFEGNQNYSARDGVLYNKTGNKIIAFPAGREGTYTVPQDVEVIGFGAFENSRLTSVLFADDINLLTIGYRAFYNAQGLTCMEIPASVISVDYYAFAQCSSLQTVTFAEGSHLTGIYEGAFYECQNLTDITLPDSVVEISDYAFYNCMELDRIPVSETSALTGVYDWSFAYTGIAGEFVLPEQLMEVGDYAFRGTNITALTISDTNAEQLVLGIGAWQECDKLETIDIPFSGASYGDEELYWFAYIFGAGAPAASGSYVPANLKFVKVAYATPTPEDVTYNDRDKIIDTWFKVFYNSFDASKETLEEIVLPEGLTTIDNSAFSGFSKLTSVTIPDSVTRIDHWQFYQCSNLKEIIVSEDHYSYRSVDGILYNKEKTIIISVPCGTAGAVAIPDGVTSIGSFAFYQCSALTSITIPDSVTSIGSFAFYQCSALTSITIPDSVTSIDDSAFFGCSNLTGVYITDLVKWCQIAFESDQANPLFYAHNLYHNGMLVTDLVIPDGVTSIGKSAFYNCSSLTSITIPDSVTSIGENAFLLCTNLSEVLNHSALPLTIGSSDYGYVAEYARVLVDAKGNKTYMDGEVTYINTTDGFRFELKNGIYTLRAYLGTEEAVTLPLNMDGNAYRLNAFVSGTIRYLTLPDGWTGIDEYAFRGCSHLMSVTIPDSVMYIGWYAFDGCSSLTSVTIGNGVTSIDDYAFSGCSSLTSVTIGNGVTRINDYAFSGCSGLTSVTLPKCLVALGDGVFGNSGIETIVVPSENDRFIWQDGLLYSADFSEIYYVAPNVITVTLPQGLQSIPDLFFSGCSSLTSITIPDSVTSIGYKAFAECNSLTGVYITDLTKWCQIGFYSDYTNPLFYAHNLYLNGTLITDLVIPDSVTSIWGAFYGCSSLTSVTIPNSVTSIGNSTFYGCSSLTSVTIPNSVTSIGNSTFYGCSSLTSITIPDSVTSIGPYAFFGCSSLTSITIPDSVTSIGNSTFYGCSRLYEVINHSALPLTIGSSDYGHVASDAKVLVDAEGNKTYEDGEVSYVDTADGFRFELKDGTYTLIAYCGSESTVTLPLNIHGNSYQISNFIAGAIRHLILPDGMTSIGDGAFSGCTGLTSITIPNSVNSIGENVVSGTAYYNDPSNWTDGVLYLDNWLFKVSDEVTHLELLDVRGIASGAFSGAYHLTDLTVDLNLSSSYGLSSLTNLVTLRIFGSTSQKLSSYFGSSVPTTLQNVVLQSGFDVHSSKLFDSITGVTVFAEASRVDCPWDDDYPGWNNENKVVYGDDWYCATFLDFDGNIISRDLYLSSQVIRPPHLELPASAEYAYRLLGWDTNGDGVADSLPANVLEDVTARAVILKEVASYRVEFMDLDGKTVLYRYDLSYLSDLPTPTAPTKRGYTFLGWSGVPADGKVTSNLRILSTWKHDGAGHTYTVSVVDPTCTEQGYTLHLCTVCGESYKTDPVAARGHSFSDWVIDSEETCTTDGLRHHGCSVCEAESSEIIPAHGHAYTGSITRAATCSSEGVMTYVCTECGDRVTESLPKTEHTYQKQYASQTWLQWLIERLLNIFFGFEGDRGYYFVCTECGHIKTTEESATTYAAGVLDATCDHALGEWVHGTDATCEGYGLEVRICGLCGKTVEARNAEEPIGHLYLDEVIASTCTTMGYTKHTCEHCGEYYLTDLTAVIVHTTSDWIIDAEASCTTDGHRHKECTVCQKLLESETVEAHGHTEVKDSAVEATCTNTGLTEGKHCSVCQAVLKAQTTVAKKRHTSSDWIIDAEASCTTDGHRHKECTFCQKLLESETVEAHGHTYDQGIEKIAAEVSHIGIRVYECSDCGYCILEEIPKIVPNMLEQLNVSWTNQSDNPPMFRSDAPITDFVEVRINGEVLDSEHYIVREGSTIIELKPDYLKSLENGRYSIDIVSVGGVASSYFTIEYHSNMMWMWGLISVAVLLLGGFSTYWLVLRKKQRTAQGLHN